jgi:hypothetical protein
LERDTERSYLVFEDSDEDPMDQLRGHSITYRSDWWGTDHKLYLNDRRRY